MEEENTTIGMAPSDAFNNQAQWIWTDDDPSDAHVWIFARRTFEIEAVKEEAWIEINADLRYLLWLNGKPVGFGPPKYHAQTATVDRYDLTPWIKPGRNVIVVRVYSYGAARELSSCMPIRGALRVAVGHIDGALVSDGDWKVRRELGYVSSTVERGEVQPPLECFDARQSLGSVWLPEYDDADWEHATVLPELDISPHFELRDIPLFSWREHEADRCLQTGVSCFTQTVEETGFTHLAEEIWQARRLPDSAARISHKSGMGGAPELWRMDAIGLSDKEGVYALWDSGRIWTGYPYLSLRGSPGAVVDVSFGECLQEGRVNPVKNGLHYLERIVLGDAHIEHRFTWPKCYRYIQVDVRSGWVELQPPVLERSAYPVERKGFFTCSDPVLEQAWEISMHTVELCMEDSYMDTPWRERGSWLGDDIPKMLANYAVFGDLALARRFLLHHARGQRDSGQMAGKYPGAKTSLVSTWTLMFPVSVREYIRYGGEPAFGREMLPVIARIIDWMEQYLLPEGVYGNLPLEVTAETNIYNFIDAAPVDTSGANAAWNAHAYACLQAAVYLARQAGEEKLAIRWQERANRLREAFSRLFWDEERGVYINGWHDGLPIKRWGCQENYLAVYYGIAEPNRRDRIMARLKQENLLAVFKPDSKCYDAIIPGIDGNHGVAIALNRYRWDENDMVPLGGPYFAWFALEALLDLGMTDEALSMIGTHWGEFSRQGGTTVWETWYRDHGSLSHGWGCAPAIVLQKFILGVRLSEEKEIDLEILPQRGNLTWAQGRVNTPYGLVQVAWKYHDRWLLEVDLPDGCNARVGLPETLECSSETEPHTCYQQTYETVVVQGGHHEFKG